MNRLREVAAERDELISRSARRAAAKAPPTGDSGRRVRRRRWPRHAIGSREEQGRRAASRLRFSGEGASRRALARAGGAGNARSVGGHFRLRIGAEVAEYTRIALTAAALIYSARLSGGWW